MKRLINFGSQPVETPKKDEREILLFVCTGNTCRSPMAASIAQQELGDHYICKSAGTGADDDDKVNDEAGYALERLGYEDTTDRYAKYLTKEMIEEADKIFCLGKNTLEILQLRFPENQHKFFEYYASIPNLEGVPDPADKQYFDQVGAPPEILQGTPEAYDFVARMMKDQFTPAIKRNLEAGLYSTPSETMKLTLLEKFVNTIFCRG